MALIMFLQSSCYNPCNEGFGMVVIQPVLKGALNGLRRFGRLSQTQNQDGSDTIGFTAI